MGGGSSSSCAAVYCFSPLRFSVVFNHFLDSSRCSKTARNRINPHSLPWTTFVIFFNRKRLLFRTFISEFSPSTWKDLLRRCEYVTRPTRTTKTQGKACYLHYFGRLECRLTVFSFPHSDLKNSLQCLHATEEFQPEDQATRRTTGRSRRQQPLTRMQTLPQLPPPFLHLASKDFRLGQNKT